MAVGQNDGLRAGPSPARRSRHASSSAAPSRYLRPRGREAEENPRGRRKMKKNQYRARVECLEEREVPSGVHPAAASVSDLRLQARGRAGFVSQQAIPQGSYQIVSVLKGTSRTLGHFTGQLVLNY